MGVPGFFGWLLKHYKEHNMLQNNLDNTNVLYIDANCLVHPQCKIIADMCSDIYDIERLENKMFQRICNYLNFLLLCARPSDEFFIAIDGPAPLAKINQQRKRRIRTKDDNDARNEIKRKYNIPINDNWDSTRITPGTEFMERLHQYLLGYINELAQKMPSLKITYSSYHTGGEGEHKILEDIRYKQQNDSSFNDKNICIYGLDADLIFLAMASQKKNIFLLRETVQFNGKQIKKEIYDIIKDVSEDMTYLCIDNMKDCYNKQIINIINKRIETNKIFDNNQNKLNIDDITKFSNDFVVLCYLLGNDFLPHLPSIDIKREGLDILIDTYVDAYLTLHMNLIDENHNINQHMFMEIIKSLGENETEYFQHIKPKYDYRMSKRQCMSQNPYEKEIWEMDNLKNIQIDDCIMLGIGSPDQWKYRYYEYYFHTSEYQQKTIDNLCHNFLEGIIWTTRYYFNGCPAWLWQYKYSHSPFLSDIYNYLNKNDFNINDIQFKQDSPIQPLTQLLAVFPSHCYHELPIKYHRLMLAIDSPIIDMYPKKVRLDLINKDLLWQGIPFLPYLDIDRIINAIKGIKIDKLDEERNKMCDNFVMNMK